MRRTKEYVIEVRISVDPELVIAEMQPALAHIADAVEHTVSELNKLNFLQGFTLTAVIR